MCTGTGWEIANTEFLLFSAAWGVAPTWDLGDRSNGISSKDTGLSTKGKKGFIKGGATYITCVRLNVGLFFILLPVLIGLYVCFG